MNKDVLISPAIKYQPQWYAMDIWMQETFSRIDLSKLLLYFVDICDDRVLPFLAEEFDVLGKKGWDFCRNKDEQRALIRMSIQLHRFKGTPWAVKRAMEQAGLTGFTLTENTGSGPTGWAVFRISVPFSLMPTDPTIVLNAIALANVYKNARSVMEGIFFTGLDFEDGVSLNEQDLIIDGDPTTMGDGVGTMASFRYDGAVAYDGSRNWADELDCITITLV